MEQTDKTKEELQQELQALQQEFLLYKKLHEKAVTKNNDHQIESLYKAIEQSPILTFIVNVRGFIKYVNPKVFELTGFSSQELIGKNLLIFSSGNKSKEDYEAIFEILKEKGTWKGEFINKKKNGEIYHTYNSISKITNEDGNVESYIVFH